VVGRANSLFAGQSEIQDANAARFTRLSQKFNLDPETVVFDLSEGVEQPQQAPESVTPNVTAPQILTIDDLDKIIRGAQ
jgi:hypothetical protein